MKRSRIVASLVLSIAVATPLNASPCSDAVDRYNNVLADVSSYLRRYARCVEASAGKDDCSSEFRRLKSAQSDLEDAVSQISSDCTE